MATEIDKARAEAAIMELEESLKKGSLSAQQIDMLEQAQSETPFGYDPSRSSPEAVNLVTLYHNQTGAPHPTPEYMIRNFLTRKFPHESWVPATLRGTSVYSLKPNDKYHVPTLHCWLSSQSERKAEIEALGIFDICEKGSGFNNEFEVETHMRSTHRRQFEAIQRDETRREQREYMELQRAILEASRANMTQRSGAEPRGPGRPPSVNS